MAPCLQYNTPLTKKHLQVLNSIHCAYTQNYTREDKASNYHHYTNKAIILGWHVSYAAKAMLLGLEWLIILPSSQTPLPVRCLHNIGPPSLEELAAQSDGFQ